MKSQHLKSVIANFFLYIFIMAIITMCATRSFGQSNKHLQVWRNHLLHKTTEPTRVPNLIVNKITPSETTSKAAEHYALGNPSNAQNTADSTNNYLIEKPQYVCSYNRSKGISNWVSWHSERQWLGPIQRQNYFHADLELPNYIPKTETYYYTNSGFDKGHLCPSADRTNNLATNYSTFAMTNIIPQAPNVNQHNWADLESYCRYLLFHGSELYIIAGQYGIGGIGNNNGIYTKLYNGKVTVPSNIWKVIIALPNGTNDLNRINQNTQIIAVNIPNQNSVGLIPWQNFKTSIDFIEANTGLNLLSNLRQSLQDSIESKIY